MQNRRPPQGVFEGRAAELAQVTEVIAMVETGQPWLVAIEGDPGVGKTALARRCLAEAEGVSLRVLPARADQTEADLDFGLVDQLLRVRDAIYAGIPAARRRLLHARAASVVSEAVSWKHRVAALDRPDEDLAAELEQSARQPETTWAWPTR